MSEILSDNNVVEVMGKIVSEVTFSHEVYGEGFYSFTIEAARLSDNKDYFRLQYLKGLLIRNF